MHFTLFRRHGTHLTHVSRQGTNPDGSGLRPFLRASRRQYFSQAPLSGRYGAPGRLDRSGIAAHRCVDRLLHGSSAGSASLQHAGAFWLGHPGVTVGVTFHGARVGPVLTSLMVAGRNSSGMASELGSMIVSEQIDAMRALGTDPMKKLVTPRVVSTVFMLFFLTIISDLVGLTGGLFIAKVLLRLDARQYWYNAWQTLVFQDVFMGLLKPVLFGFIIATIGCFYGMNARGGTQGVGRATTQAVVAASVLILAFDLFITRFLMVTLAMN